MSAMWLWLLIAMNLLWAGTVSMYKYLGAYVDGGTIATLRFGVAAVCLLACWPWLPGNGPRGWDMVRSLIIGVSVFCISPRLQIEGVHRGHAGDTSLLVALEPLIVALGAALFLKETIVPRRWWGFGLGILGMTLISQFWRDDVTGLQGLLANFIFVSSFVCEASFSVIGKPMLGRVSPLKLIGCGLVGGTIANTAISGVHVGTLPIQGWLIVIYLAVICTVIGYALWYFAIRHAPVNLVGLTVFVQPVAGLILATLWLGAPLHWGQLWGSLVIVMGLAIALRRERTDQARTKTACNSLVGSLEK